MPYVPVPLEIHSKVCSEGPFTRCSSRHIKFQGSLFILFTTDIFITANKNGKMHCAVVVYLAHVTNSTVITNFY